MNVSRIKKDEVTFEIKPIGASGSLIHSLHDKATAEVTITHKDAVTLYYRLGEVIDRDPA